MKEKRQTQRIHHLFFLSVIDAKPFNHQVLIPFQMHRLSLHKTSISTSVPSNVVFVEELSLLRGRDASVMRATAAIPITTSGREVFAWRISMCCA
ncbi:Protein of unknown function [Pyronema omphalodes CBS 100304]|uniref:Uncharacterized protein n=1 Tax=Pyronema omphalodes (strain CBS 100304) TaxID=1076935 RepID=U4LFQ9_PYROM|nr:Protein of unknown function [Pyronema omphalodes CBS 100304]